MCAFRGVLGFEIESAFPQNWAFRRGEIVLCHELVTRKKPAMGHAVALGNSKKRRTRRPTLMVTRGKGKKITPTLLVSHGKGKKITPLLRVTHGKGRRERPRSRLLRGRGGKGGEGGYYF